EQFRVSLNGGEYSLLDGLKTDEFMVNDTVDRLTLLNITGRKAINPANGSETAVIRNEGDLWRICQQAGLTTWGPTGYRVLKLSAELRRNAAEFQTADVTNYMLDSLRASFPELVGAALRRFSIEQIRQVLCHLLEEELSIRDLRSILESMLAVNGTT